MTEYEWLCLWASSPGEVVGVHTFRFLRKSFLTLAVWMYRRFHADGSNGTRTGTDT